MLEDIGSHFFVIEAKYGNYDRWLDVTYPARRRADGSGLRSDEARDLAANLPDPAHGTRKTLVVQYRYQGEHRLGLFGEYEPVVLPPAG